MEFIDAIKALIGAPHLVAFRIPGPQLTMTRRSGIWDHSGPKPRQYRGCLADYLAIDWQVMKQQDFAAFIQRLYEEAKAQQLAVEQLTEQQIADEGK